MEKYTQEDGMSRMLLDLSVAAEIQDQVSEATEKAKNKDSIKKPKSSDAKGMVARMQQRRQKRLNENGL